MKNSSYKYYLLLCCMLVHFGHIVSAQEGPSPGGGSGLPVFANPSIASFGDNSMLSVGRYTGAPNISIPVTSVSYRNVTIPVTLNYTSGKGVKPDVFPGIVGNGWDISLGGEITKIENSLSSESYLSIVGAGTPIPIDNDFLNDGDWSGSLKMETLIKDMTTLVSSKDVNDRYAFSFLGRSGVIYKDPLGNFKIKTSDGEELKVTGGPMTSYIPNMIPFEAQDTSLQGQYSLVSGGPDPGNNIYIAKFVYWFVIVDSRGVKYEFGGTPNSIDFVRPGLQPTKSDAGQYLTSAKKWMLTKVTFPQGDSILLNYERRKFFITSQIEQKFRYYYIDGTLDPLDLSMPQPAVSISSTLTNPCYLKEIITPIQKVSFKWSNSKNQLQYKFNIPNPPSGTEEITLNDSIELNHLASSIYFCKYPSIWNASLKDRSPDKLDSVIVYDIENQVNQTVCFNYTNDTTTRLKLLKLDIYGRNFLDTVHYKFGYNSKTLPSYLSMQSDHFGYYNGTSIFPFSLDTGTYISYFSNPVNRALYTQSREPDPDFADAEILEKITLPTGGYVKYTYEPNSYGGYTTHWPNTYIGDTLTKITGGLRVKKIERYADDSTLADKKSFIYQKNFISGGTRSSGVLSHRPVYYEEYYGDVKDTMRNNALHSYDKNDVVYKYWSTSSINPMDYYHGDFITYSEVTEQNGDHGGFTTYKFSNYDNGYLDLPVENQIMDDRQVSQVWKNDEENNLALERGKVLQQAVYDSAGNILAKTIHEYNDDPSRFLDHSRAMILRSNPNYAIRTPSIRYVAKLIYNYHHYLKKTTQIMYDGADSSVTTQLYAYTPQKLLMAHTSYNSLGDTIVKRYTYPTDSTGVAVYDSMVAQHYISPVLSEKRLVNDELTNTAKTSYQSITGKLHMPASTTTSLYDDATGETTRFTVYDPTGNILEAEKEDGIKQVYLWGYKGQYPVAQVLGSSWDTVKSVVDTGLLNNGTPAQIKTQLDNLRGYFSGNPMVSVTTYTYRNGIGIASQTDGNGRTLYYDYDNFNRLSLVRDENGAIIKKICYNYAGQEEDCTAACAGTTPLWVNTDSVGLCEMDGIYKTGFLLQQQRDINICSPTFGQLQTNRILDPYSCKPDRIYAKLYYENLNYGPMATFGDVVVRFYLDSAGTIPYSVVNLPLNYEIMSSPPPCDFPIPAIDLPRMVSGSSYILATQTVLATMVNDNCGWVLIPPENCPSCPPEEGTWVEICESVPCQSGYALLPGTGYIIIN